MNLQRFEQLIAAYGSQAHHWPVAERQAALSWLQQQPDNALYCQAQQLDMLLNQSVAPLPAPQLYANILAKICPTPFRDGYFYLCHWLWGESQWQHCWRPALLLGLPLLLGLFASGLSTPSVEDLLWLDLEQSWVLMIAGHEMDL